MIVIGVILSVFYVYKLHIGMNKTILDLVIFPLPFSLFAFHWNVQNKSKFGYIVLLFVCLNASYWNVQNKPKFGYISFNFCSYVSLWNVPKKSKFDFYNPIGVCLLPHSTK